MLWVWEFSIFKDKINWVYNVYLCNVRIYDMESRKKKQLKKKRPLLSKFIVSFYFICISRMRLSETDERGRKHSWMKDMENECNVGLQV